MIYKKNTTVVVYMFMLCFILVGTIVIMEGKETVTKKTETISCEGIGTDCEVTTPEGETITIKAGETIIRNQQNMNILNIANYGVWLIILISLIINHFIENKNYTIKNLKQDYKEIKDRLP